MPPCSHEASLRVAPVKPDYRLWLLFPLLLVLMLTSLLVGVAELNLWNFSAADWQLLLVSRIPRTLAVMLTGMSLAVAGMIMQLLARNRFVEPSTTGTLESALLGILLVTLFAPDMSVAGRMLVATLTALAGSLTFMALLRAVPLHSTLLVPLIGIMFASVIGALVTFIAYRYNLLQSLANWTNGDFSAVVRGRYEILWLTLGCTLLAYVYADRFTLAGMGRNFTTNLGLNYNQVLLLGLLLVSMVSAVTVVTAGILPFLGLIVPNLVSLVLGDHLRRSLPWVAFCGALFMLICDLAARLLRYPYEVPIGTVMGVIGSVFFIWLLLRNSRPAHD